MACLGCYCANHWGTKNHEHQQPYDPLLIICSPKKDHLLPIPSLTWGVDGELDVVQSIGPLFLEELWVMEGFGKECIVSTISQVDSRVLFITRCASQPLFSLASEASFSVIVPLFSHCSTVLSLTHIIVAVPTTVFVIKLTNRFSLHVVLVTASYCSRNCRNTISPVLVATKGINER